jgi:hypothetical protein
MTIDCFSFAVTASLLCVYTISLVKEAFLSISKKLSNKFMSLFILPGIFRRFPANQFYPSILIKYFSGLAL